MDIDMPIMNGMEACESIRAYEAQNDLDPVFIVIITADLPKNKKKHSIDGNLTPLYNKILKKPVNLE